MQPTFAPQFSVLIALLHVVQPSPGHRASFPTSKLHIHPHPLSMWGYGISQEGQTTVFLICHVPAPTVDVNLNSRWAQSKSQWLSSSTQGQSYGRSPIPSMTVKEYWVPTAFPQLCHKTEQKIEKLKRLYTVFPSAIHIKQGFNPKSSGPQWN